MSCTEKNLQAISSQFSEHYTHCEDVHEVDGRSFSFQSRKIYVYMLPKLPHFVPNSALFTHARHSEHTQQTKTRRDIADLPFLNRPHTRLLLFSAHLRTLVPLNTFKRSLSVFSFPAKAMASIPSQAPKQAEFSWSNPLNNNT